MGNNENENKSMFYDWGWRVIDEQLDIYGYNEYESYIEEKRKERRERIKHDKKVCVPSLGVHGLEEDFDFLSCGCGQVLLVSL